MSDIYDDCNNKKALLWVDCATGATHAPELSGAVRQHVMLNYLANQIPAPPKALQVRTKRKNGEKQTFPRPKIALVIPQDHELYKAVWWHKFMPQSSCLDWKQKFKSLQDDALWDLAQDDAAMREVFMAFAANKEGAVKGWEGRTRSYLIHKGRAIEHVSQRVSLEGGSLDFVVVTAIALLSKAAFTEGDFESAEMHASAVSQLVRDRMASMPKFLWLLAAWSDLKITGATARAPRLPLFIHPEFKVAIPTELRSRAASMAESHRRCLSDNDTFSEDFLVRMFTKIFTVAFVYDADDMDWAAATAVSYQTAHFLACVQCEYNRAMHRNAEQKRGALYFIATRLQFWGMLAPFVEPNMSHAFILQEAQQSPFDSDPQAFYYKWTAESACLECLLWILTNIYTSTSLYFPTNASATLDRLDWLSKAMKLAKDELKIQSVLEFEQCLRNMPFSKNWNGLLCQSMWDCLTS